MKGLAEILIHQTWDRGISQCLLCASSGLNGALVVTTGVVHLMEFQPVLRQTQRRHSSVAAHV